MIFKQPGWEYRSVGPYFLEVNHCPVTTGPDMDAVLQEAVIAMMTKTTRLMVVSDGHGRQVFGYDRAGAVGVGTRESTDMLIGMVDMVEDMETSLVTLQMAALLQQAAEDAVDHE